MLKGSRTRYLLNGRCVFLWLVSTGLIYSARMHNLVYRNGQRKCSFRTPPFCVHTPLKLMVDTKTARHAGIFVNGGVFLCMISHFHPPTHAVSEALFRAAVNIACHDALIYTLPWRRRRRRGVSCTAHFNLRMYCSAEVRVDV